MRQSFLTAAIPVLITITAILAALLLFGGFVAMSGVDPTQVWYLLFKGAFGDWFSWQNTLQRAAPLMLTALCVAIPARAGLVIIGGEGALVLGGLACAALPYLFSLPANIVGTVLVCIAGGLAGGLWIMLAGYLRQFRGINETISSLLLGYVAIGIFKHLVEGPLRDPSSLNKPSTYSLSEGLRIGGIGGSDIHWGLVIGVAACLVFSLWLRWTVSGFSIRVVGGNPRAAQLVGLPASKLILMACALGGACAGVAGAVKWRPCTPMPMLPLLLSMAIPVSWCPSLHAITRWPLFRWRFSSEALVPQGVCCNDAWGCQMHPYWSSRASRLY